MIIDNETMTILATRNVGMIKEYLGVSGRNTLAELRNGRSFGTADDGSLPLNGKRSIYSSAIN
jgi:hypothetical protein